MKFKDRLAQLRKEFGLTQVEFAEKIGFSRTAISAWEIGRNEPSNEDTIKIANFFNVSVDYIIGKSEYKNEIDYFNKNSKNNSEFLAFASLPEADFVDFKKLELVVNQLIKTVNKDEYNKILNNYLNCIPVNMRERIKDYIFMLCDYGINFSHNETTNDNIPTFNKITNKIPVVGKIAAGQPILAQENIEGYLPVDPNIYGLTSTEDLFYLLVAGQSMNMKVKNGDYALIHKQDYAEDGDIVVAIVNGDNEATLKRYKRLNDQFVLLEPMSTDPSIEAITVDLKNTNFQIVGKAIGQFGKF